MTLSRRHFLRSAVATGAAGVVAASPLHGRPPAVRAEEMGGGGPRRALQSRPRYDPWIELDPDALRQNVLEVSRLAGGRPVLAVVKNNAYGLGTVAVGRLLDPMAEIGLLAVVKVDEAFDLLDAGVRTPILLMGLAPPEVEEELAERGVRLALFDDGARPRLERLASRLGRPVPVHLYLDTGMRRLGVPEHRALEWLEGLAGTEAVEVEGSFMAFSESEDFDPEQVRRFRTFAEDARGLGLPVGSLHAASSHGLFTRPDALFDAVRPGLALYGAYPAGARDLGRATLTPVFRLHARVVRVERLAPGDGVSYGRNYVAEAPVWTATLPVGHADGFPREAVQGCEVVVGGATYPVIGAVSASHTIVELGEETSVSPGDLATLVGPEESVHPNEVASRTGRSVYDVLMHLNPSLPVVVPGR